LQKIPKPQNAKKEGSCKKETFKVEEGTDIPAAEKKEGEEEKEDTVNLKVGTGDSD